MAKFAKVEKMESNDTIYINIENISFVKRTRDCWIINISGEEIYVKHLPECLQQPILEL